MPWNKTVAGDLSVAERILTLGQARFVRVDNGSAPMNIDGTPAGAVDVLWNGTGAGDTGGDWTPSGEGSETAGSMHSGTNGWDSGVAAKDGSTIFDNGSMIDVAGTHQTLEFWLNTQAFPVGSFLSLQWLNDLGGSVGARLDVNDYVTNFDAGVWQKVSIPITDFGLTGNVQKFAVIYRKTAGQHFHLDDIELLQSSGGGGPFVFEVAAPDANTRYHISMLVLLISGAASGWNAGNFANIAALTNGLLVRQRNKTSGFVSWSLNSKDNTDLFGRFHPQDDITFADGTLLVGFMVKPGKASVIVTNEEVLEVVVGDDLSGLVEARGFAHFGIEVV